MTAPVVIEQIPEQPLPPVPMPYMPGGFVAPPLPPGAPSPFPYGPIRPPYLAGASFPVPVPYAPAPRNTGSGNVTIGAMKDAPPGWTYELGNDYHAQQGYVSPNGQFFADPGDEWKYIAHLDPRNRDRVTVDYAHQGYWWDDSTYEMVPVINEGSGRPPWAASEGQDQKAAAEAKRDAPRLADLDSRKEFATADRYYVQEEDAAIRKQQEELLAKEQYEAVHRYDIAVTEARLEGVVEDVSPVPVPSVKQNTAAHDTAAIGVAALIGAALLFL